VKIKAKLISASGEKFPIVLSIIRTYRSSFALTLKEKGIDGLIADLRGKNAR